MRQSSDVDSLNDQIVAALDGLPALSEVPIDDVRTARDEGRSIFGEVYVSDRATVESVSTPRGDIPIRVIRPVGGIRGVYLHFHGGGWALGAAHHQDRRLEQLADATNQVAVSVEYRLAPEHPYPAGPDDCEAAAVAIIESMASRFDAATATIGGESAGAHLALVTMLRLRDRHGFTAFAAANLLYGVFDLRLTPSARLYGPGPQVLTSDSVRWFIDLFADESVRDMPDVSPLLADLSALPPTIFTVGTNDPLLDDTLFMHQRWQAAGLESLLQVFADAPHAFDAFSVEITREAHRRIHGFLSERVR